MRILLRAGGLQACGMSYPLVYQPCGKFRDGADGEERKKVSGGASDEGRFCKEIWRRDFGAGGGKGTEKDCARGAGWLCG